MCLANGCDELPYSDAQMGESPPLDGGTMMISICHGRLVSRRFTIPRLRTRNRPIQDTNIWWDGLREVSIIGCNRMLETTPLPAWHMHGAILTLLV